MSEKIAVRPGALNLITDVRGLSVGNAQDMRVASGVTVILPDSEAVAAVDVRGGAPGTRETDALDPACLVERIHGVVLSGGSAYGLEAASSLANWLGARDRGFRIAPNTMPVPVVPAAILFDLANGGDKKWGEASPYAALARVAAEQAGAHFELGNSGAGFGAQAGFLKGGLGSASAVFEDDGKIFTVGALVAVNALGSPVEAQSGAFWGAPYALGADESAALRHGVPNIGAGQSLHPLANSKYGAAHGAAMGANTTIAVVACDAILNPVEVKRLAIMAHDGLARALKPVHSALDGDSVFALATEHVELPAPRPFYLSALGAVAADCLTRAVMRAILHARSLGSLKCYRDIYG